MYLIKTELEGTNFTVKFVTGQTNQAPVGIDVNTHIFKALDTKVLTRYPVGTYFIVSEISWGDIQSTAIGHARPVCFEQTVYSSTSNPENTASNADVNYFIDFLIETNHPIEHIKKIANDFVAGGYIVDVEDKIKSRKADTSGTLKEQIKRLYPCPSNEDIGFHIEEDIWYLLIRNILRGENTLLVGPTGSGKTELVSHIAKALSKPLNIQDMGTIQDAQSALLGVHRLNKEGHSAFDYAPFVGHVQQEGIVLLDELNRSPLAANNILFPCLDKRRYLPIDIACDDCDRKIEVNKDCVFFATANLGSEYSGTTMIDRALLDRFFVVELSYPSEKAETSILVNKTGVNEKTAKAIVKVSKQIREQYKSQELSNVVSVRHTLLVASLIQDGFDTVGALEKVIMPLFDEADGISERSKVKSIIAAN
jgi:MoxR-like ATPase